MKNVLLKPSSKLILPEDIPAVEAVRLGLATPPRRVGNIKLPAIPAGMGVFAKYAVKIIDESGNAVAFKSPKTGKLVKKLEGPSHSFTRSFGQIIRAMFQNPTVPINANEVLTDDTGATFTSRVKSAIVTGTIAVVSGLAKIKFGSLATALSTTQTNLQGVLLGPTTEAAVAVALVAETTVQTIFTVTGQITNGSGGPFTVEEMGIFSELGNSAGAANNTTMVLRDLTGPVIVANAQTIIGQYTFTIAV
jgi:hypothetical protein